MVNLVEIYSQDPIVQTISKNLEAGKKIRLKGLAGSSDAVLCAAVSELELNMHICILGDREEAEYFLDDIQTLLPNTLICFFPNSYKKPYQFEEVDNANVLSRAESLSAISNRKKEDKLICITYPEALYEKVITKKSLVENTFTVKIGDKLDLQFISEVLFSYDFEKSDFVYEPGQFSVRGGIVDVYSYSREKPVRIELFGDEIESIREFNVETQLSNRSIDYFQLIPDIQTRLTQSIRESLLEYLPEDTVWWIKDIPEMLTIINEGYKKAEDSFHEIVQKSGNIKVVNHPEALFTPSNTWQEGLKERRTIEFGKKYYYKTAEEFQFSFKPQAAFHRNFTLLTEDLRDRINEGYQNFILADSEKQTERLQSIFSELESQQLFIGLQGSLREGFLDPENKYTWYTDHQIFERFHKVKQKDRFSKKKALTLRELKSLQTGDYVAHIDYGVARFGGLDTVEVSGKKQEVLRLIFKDDDLLYLSVHSLHKITRYAGKEGQPPSINKLGSQEWENKKKRVKKQVKDIAKELIDLYAKRKAAPGYAFPKDNFLQVELESSFMYEDTPDQASATLDVKKDMELAHPMDRLVCGDVGFGKTEVAIRAAFKAVNAGKQVALLVPTTILAMQHYNTVRSRLKDFPISIEYINRFKSTKEQSQTLKETKEGKIDILIGTHRIVNKDVVFKDLGLLIIDEEQKFGVKIKERLKEMRVNIDVLTLTATPIPRTLHFSLMGARDLSVIATPPPNRRPVTTEVHEFSEELIRDAIHEELKRGGQVFFVHNRVSDIENLANTILKLVPDAKIGIAHGQMEGSHLEKVMLKFIGGEYDVLVSTNIIESGLDIPNANTIIINRAHMFGLSDLHQMRGRVGRSNIKSYCYLLTPPTNVLTADSRKRLHTLEEFSDLGDGFKVALRDLDIRGAGNLLGSEQSGFINDMGFEMYHKILDEAISELKETDFKELFDGQEASRGVQQLVQDCVIETDLEILIPVNYVSSTTERLQLYTQLDNISTEEELKAFSDALKDRFGPIPLPVEELLESVKLRWLAIKMGMDRLSLKQEALKCYFEEKPSNKVINSPEFTNMLQYVQLYSRRCQIKELKGKLILTVQEINNIHSAIQFLEDLVSFHIKKQALSQ